MAGASVPTPEGKGGKKSVDFVVNLVPTIDLLSVLISFLLLTAVWTQLARINIDQAVQRTTDKQKETQEQEKMLNILVGKNGISINFTGEPPTQIPKPYEYKHKSILSNDEYETYLKIQTDYKNNIKKVLGEYKKRAGENQKVIVASEDDVQYNFLILVMDSCLDLGLNKIIVADESAVKTEML